MVVSYRINRNAELLKSVKLFKLVMLGDPTKTVKHVDNMDPRGVVRHLPNCAHRPCYGTAATYSWGDTSLIDWVIKGNHSEYWETCAVDFQCI